MIRPDTAAVFIAEGEFQESGKSQQQLVAFRKAVLRVKELHPAKIHVKENRLLAILYIVISRGFSKLKEVSHARKPRQVIILICFQDAFFMKGLVHGVPQARPFLGLLIGSFINIPDIGEPYALFDHHMLTGGMDRPVPIRRKGF